MSDSNTSNASNAPLFQGMDDKERIYAPDQMPNNIMPDHEMDAGSGQARGSGNRRKSGANRGR
jgi:hypothetical protein